MRWICPTCGATSIRKRSDVKQRRVDKLIRDWILEGKKLKHLAIESGFHKHYLQSLISAGLNTFRISPHSRALDSAKPLILDGTWISWRQLVALVACDGERVVDWMFAPTENILTWSIFLSRLEGKPSGIVSDAQKGLLKAIRMRFGPDVPHQRCIAHITRQARIWLTRQPQTIAGQELLKMINELHAVKTHGHAQYWTKSFDAWLAIHEAFLKAKTKGVGKQWWYTHKKLRAARSLLLRARRELFTYLDHPIPSITNHLEGGINSPLKFVFSEHRGLSLKHKKQAVNLFLSKRAEKKKNPH